MMIDPKYLRFDELAETDHKRLKKIRQLLKQGGYLEFVVEAISDHERKVRHEVSSDDKMPKELVKLAQVFMPGNGAKSAKRR